MMKKIKNNDHLTVCIKSVEQKQEQEKYVRLPITVKIKAYKFNIAL